MKLADRIRELHNQKQFEQNCLKREMNQLSNEELIDLISEAGDEWIDHKVRSYQTETVAVDPDFDK